MGDKNNEFTQECLEEILRVYIDEEGTEEMYLLEDGIKVIL